MISHFFRCISCGRQHGDNQTASHCCAFVQEIFRCDNCLAEFPTEAKAQAHQQRNPITECEAMAIADGVNRGIVTPAERWADLANCQRF